MEAVEPDIMEKKPKPKNEGLFANGMGIRTVLQGAMFGALALIAYFIGRTISDSISVGQTMAFIVLGLSQVVQSFNMRSDRSLFRIGPFTNKTLNLSALASVGLTALILFTPARIAFGLELLSLPLYGIALALSFVPLVIMELSKALGLIKHRH
jgi:Ca2+-transporting ATPase